MADAGGRSALGILDRELQRDGLAGPRRPRVEPAHPAAAVGEGERRRVDARRARDDGHGVVGVKAGIDPGVDAGAGAPVRGAGRRAGQGNAAVTVSSSPV